VRRGAGPRVPHRLRISGLSDLYIPIGVAHGSPGGPLRVESRSIAEPENARTSSRVLRDLEGGLPDARQLILQGLTATRPAPPAALDNSKPSQGAIQEQDEAVEEEWCL